MSYHYIGPPSPQEVERREKLTQTSQSRVARLHKKPRREKPPAQLSEAWKEAFYAQIDAIRRGGRRKT